jgi:hypothetical protein
LILSHDADKSREYPDAPLLADVFAEAVRDGKFAINCDVKETAAVPAILRLASEMGIGPDRLILTGSSTPSMLEEDFGIVKKAAVWLNIEEIIHDYFRTGVEAIKPWLDRIPANSDWDEITQTMALEFEPLLGPIITDCRRLGAAAVNMPYTDQTAGFIPRFIAGGLRVSVWTLNDRKSLERAVDLGVLNITTKDTVLAVKTRNIKMTPGLS